MRVLHVAETMKGGVATIIRQLMHAQNESLGTPNISALVPAEHAGELTTLAPQLHTFPRTGRNPKSFLAFLKAFTMLVLKEKPDVVHLHSTFAGFLCRPVLFLLRPIARPRVVYSPHAWCFLMENPPARKKQYALIEKLLALFTHAIICGSDYERQQAIQNGLPAGKLHLIFSGVDVPQPKETSIPASLKPKSLNLLFVGRFDRQKGFDLLQIAMKSLEAKSLQFPIHLTAVGEAVRATEKPAPAQNISYVGWLKPAELAAYFTHADVLVMPSRWESFGLVAAEAAAYGLPVIASRSCSLPEVVRHQETGLLFTPESTTELAQIIAETPAKTWATMRTAAKKHYTNNLTAARMCAQTTALYSKLLA